MKLLPVLILMLFVGVSAAGVVAYAGTRREAAPQDKKAPETQKSPESQKAAGKAPEKAPEKKAPPADPNALPELEGPKEMTAPAKTNDALVDGYGALISDLVLGRLRSSDRAAVEERAVKMLEAANLGTPDQQKTLAKDIALTLIDSASKYAPPEGARRVALDAPQLSAIGSMALNFAKNTRATVQSLTAAASQPASQPSGGPTHSGSMLTAALDFAAPAGYTKLSWKTIGGFLYKEGMTLPAEVQAFDKKKVAVGGYMMSLGEYGNIHKFLLVEAQWSCCFGEPPDINQVIVVSIPADKKGVELTSMGVMVVGTFDAKEVKEGRWVTSVYRLVADDVIELE